MALQLFDGMRQQGLLSEVITYSALISAWEKCRMTKRALHSLVGFGNSRGSHQRHCFVTPEECNAMSSCRRSWTPRWLSGARAVALSPWVALSQ